MREREGIERGREEEDRKGNLDEPVLCKYPKQPYISRWVVKNAL